MAFVLTNSLNSSHRGSGVQDKSLIDFVENLLYLHSFESMQLDGSSFNTWKLGMIISFSVKNKLGFIIGDVVKLIVENSPILSAWSHCNFMYHTSTWYHFSGSLLLLLQSRDIDASSSQFVRDDILNPSHSLFLCSSDNPRVSLVSKRLIGHGFNAWKHVMVIVLSAKNKLGFVTSAIPPLDSSCSLLQTWHCCNNMVIRWLIHTLSKGIAESMLYLTTAQSIWSDLIERFEQAKCSQIY
ncbi:hypothetical protein L6164_005639 [Bauhinia variegata]|uniref:Uncharacterized protein n=1 Tax=Bauhinia variegata TaxID=167791 RepID=A0ACB9PRX3_BAUVA|nr:hypothetical protein L6164_005639 [Bauhinia variegata]